MKVIYNNIIPFKGFKAINLFGILFVRKDANMTEVSFNHEEIHTKQIWEMLGIFFYLWYLIEYVVRLFQYKFDFHKAYRNISFEKEAYDYEESLEYCKYRFHYKWINYL